MAIIGILICIGLGLLLIIKGLLIIWFGIQFQVQKTDLLFPLFLIVIGLYIFWLGVRHISFSLH